jgi:hypothetical protein
MGSASRATRAAVLRDHMPVNSGAIVSSRLPGNEGIPLPSKHECDSFSAPANQHETTPPGANDRPQVLARHLLHVLVHELHRRAGDRVPTDEVAKTEIGDWKMPEFKTCCAFAVSLGWLILEEDNLTLTDAGMAAA